MAADDRNQPESEQETEQETEQVSEVSDEALEAVSGGTILPLPGGPILTPRLPISIKPDIYVQPIETTRIDI